MEKVFKGTKQFNSCSESFKKCGEEKLDDKIVILACQLDNKFINNQKLLSNNELEKLFINEVSSKTHPIVGSIEEYIYEYVSNVRKSTFEYENSINVSSSSLPSDVFIDDDITKNNWKSLTSSLKDEEYVNIDWHVLVNDVINGENNTNISEISWKSNKNESSSNDDVFEMNPYVLTRNVDMFLTQNKSNISSLKPCHSISYANEKNKSSQKDLLFKKRKPKKQLSVPRKSFDQSYLDVNNENINPKLNCNKNIGRKVNLNENLVIKYNNHLIQSNENTFIQKSNSRNRVNTPRTQEEHEKRFFAMLKMKNVHPQQRIKLENHNFLQNIEIRTCVTPICEDDNYISSFPDVDSEFINFINESVHKVSQSNFENF